MRTLLRSAARLARALAWLLKAALLLAAVGVGILWPLSRERSLDLLAQKYTFDGERVDRVRLLVGCDDGWLGAWSYSSRRTLGPGLPPGPTWARSSSGQWQFERSPTRRRWIFGSTSLTRLPLYWVTDHGDRRGEAWEERILFAPCWGVAPALAAWPLASVGLLLRRRARRRRRERLGLCRACGYDCRATAAAGGGLLARCPECGAAPADRDPSTAGREPAAADNPAKAV